MGFFFTLLFLITGVGFAQSDECVKIRSSKNPDHRSINIVFVGSGFRDQLDRFESSVREQWAGISEYAPFSDDVQTLNVWIVKAADRSNDFCSFSSSVERLTLCNSFKARALAGKCVPGTNRNIVVIHNSDRYGGSGGPVASATISETSARVIVHELGHSLFKLADEYTEKNASTSGPNCVSQRSSCSAWQDLIDAGLATCRPACRNGKLLASETSVMEVLTSDTFGHVNQRHICCTFRKKTGEYPAFCDQYKTIGVGLDRFCR